MKLVVCSAGGKKVWKQKTPDSISRETLPFRDQNLWSAFQLPKSLLLQFHFWSSEFQLQFPFITEPDLYFAPPGSLPFVSTKMAVFYLEHRSSLVRNTNGNIFEEKIFENTLDQDYSGLILIFKSPASWFAS